MVTVRPPSFGAAAAGNGSAEIEIANQVDDCGKSCFVNRTMHSNERPELTAAHLIVSVGRGLGSELNFNEVLGPLTDQLNAALGASLAAVMKATLRTTGRSASPARSLRRSSISLAFSPARSSIWPASRTRG